MSINLKSVLRIAGPVYVFQPLQVLKRLRLEYLWRNRKEAVVRLPWGLRITVNPHEAIGSNLAGQGIYEVAVTETLWRLTDVGDLAVDVGANIGYTASILGVRVGRDGRVLCFEPHPQLFAELDRNVEIWKKTNGCGCFDIRQVAVGEEDGLAFLHTNKWFQTNRGTAWISTDEISEPSEEIEQVAIQKLDSILPNETVGVVKIDVEGSALSVLHGMSNLLGRRAVRDIIFEEDGAFPAATHVFLKAHEYSIFGLQERFAGVSYLPDTQPRFDRVVGPIPNYLATLDAQRASSRLKPSFWRSFGAPRLVLSDIPRGNETESPI